MSVIETIYIARSEPKRLKDDLAEEAELLIDEEDKLDFIFVGNDRMVVFERKEAGDLINSFLTANEASGEPRIVAQIRGMLVHQGPDVLLCLLVEGHIRCDRTGHAQVENQRRKVPFNAIDNFLLLVQRWGIHVVRSTSIAHTVPRMVSVAEGWLSTADKSPIIMLPKAPAPQLRTLMTFPGIGVKGAQKLAEKHQTLDNVLTAFICNEDTGLGIKAYQRVREYLDTPISVKKRGE